MLRLKDVKMKPKLTALFLLVGLIPLALVGWWSSRLATDALMTKSFGQLENVREIKKSQIEKFFAERRGDMGVLLETVKTLEEEAFYKLEAVQGIKTRQIESYFEERQSDLGVLVESVGTLRAEAFRKLEAVQTIKKNRIESYFKERQSDLGVLVETVEMLREAAFEKMETVQELKKTQMEEFFDRIHVDIRALAKHEDAVKMYTHLKKYHDEMFTGATAPFDVSTTEYQSISTEDSAYLSDYVNTHGYYDMFLICAAHGHVMFTTAQEKDLGTNLGYGPYKDEALARLWRGVVETEDVVIEDFSPYTPSEGQHAAFIGMPLRDDSDKLLGVVALQIPTDRINTIVQKGQGMGETGETYLVGELDGKTSYRSDRVLKTGKIGQQKAGAEIEKVLSGNSGVEVKTGSTGDLEIVAYDPLNIAGLNWVIISTMQLEEAIAPKLEGEDDDFYTKYVEKYGYYDLFLIHPEGRVFYTVGHELDYGTNMVNGEYSDSNLGKLVQEVLDTKAPGIVDFEPYAPSNNEQCAFIAQPVLHNNEVEMLVALRLPIEAINQMVQERSGMGSTGETFLMGTLDGKLSYRSERVVKAGNVGEHNTGAEIDRAVEEAISGSSDVKVVTGSTGDLEIVAYDPLTIAGLTWVMLSTMQLEEAIAPQLEGQDEDFYSKYIEKYGYYDLFLIHPEGNVFYTVGHEADYGTNMVNGEYSGSNLGRLVQQVLDTKAPGIVDFEPYAPSNNEPCAFIAQPVLHNDEAQVLVALQLPIEAINRMVQERSGMGATGETFLMGQLDGNLSYRSERVVKAGNVGEHNTGAEIDRAVEDALSGSSESKVITGSTGDLEIIAYDPLNIAGLKWVMLSTMQLEEAIAPQLDGEDEDFYSKYITKYGYYDLFLIHPEGSVFYTVGHEADYGTNMISGTYSSSNLGRLVQDGLKSKQFGLADFEPYAPSNNEPCAFIAQPILGNNGEVEVMVALQLSLESVNNIMQEREGMGKTGETYLVGSDKLMRSDSFLDSTNYSVIASFADPNKGSVDTDAVTEVLAGNTGEQVIID